jgi:spore coat polysaccharide biosynthesis protein SpsF
MKAAILITARLKSTRLPLKVIKPIHGKPMVVHMLDRLKLANEPEEIIICTSTVGQDDPLEEIAAQEGVQCFRGDPEDVLLRLTNAAEAFDVETIISCTADNPFVDPAYIDKLYQYHIGQKNEFTKINGLPWGVFSYAISHAAMKRACDIKNERDTEVWHAYFTDTGYFRWGALEVQDTAIRWPELRLTVDTPEDFEMVTRVFDELYEPGRVFPLAGIVDLCRRKPEIPAINETVMQKPGIPIKLKHEQEHEDKDA